MENINHSAYNYNKLTNNSSSSWDLQIPNNTNISMDQDHMNLHYLHHHIPSTHNNIPLFFPSYHSHSSPPCLDQLPSSNSNLFNHHHHHQDQELTTELDDADDRDDDDEEELGAMKEMMYKIAAMQPVEIDPATIRKPRRRNVRISDDPQSVAARLRRERISERIRILQRLVPGGTKMDTASMLDEAIRYVKFLKRQIRLLGQPNNNNNNNLITTNNHLSPPQLGVNIINSNTANIVNSLCLASPAENNIIMNWGLDKLVPTKLGHTIGSNPTTASSASGRFAFAAGASSGNFGGA